MNAQDIILTLTDDSYCTLTPIGGSHTCPQCGETVFVPTGQEDTHHC